MKKFVILIFVAALVLGSCSSGSAKPSSQSDASTTTAGSSSGAKVGAEQLKVVARAYATAFIDGDPDTAHALYTARCRKAVSTANLTNFMKGSAKDYAGVTVSNIATKITGDTASVDYELSESSLSRRGQRWKIENGTWHNDEC